MEHAVFLKASRGIRSSNTYKPQTWRWLNTKQASNKSLPKVIDIEKASCFRSYSYTPRGIIRPQLFGEMNEELSLMPREAYLPRIQTLLAIWPLSCSLANWCEGKISLCTILRGCSDSLVWQRYKKHCWHVLLECASCWEYISCCGKTPDFAGNKRIICLGLGRDGCHLGEFFW